MTDTDFNELYQVYLEMVRSNPDHEDLAALRDEARAKLEIWWIEKKYESS